MLIRRVSLKNIRSYNDDRSVDFEIPEGTVLFEGDVGSGKSSILYAIEFALFGLGETSGDYLLSGGKEEGYVSLYFTAGGRDYEVHRGLRRHKTGVTQVNCHLSSGSEKTELSASDLKERIITLLNYNEPQHPKAESMVYRFAVFTPQEQMKEILLRNPEERLQVIRRVLGMQSYKTAADNAEVLERRLKNGMHGLQKASEDLGEKEARSKSVSESIAQLDSQIPDLEREKKEADEELRNLDSVWKALRDDREQLQMVVGRIPELERGLNRTDKEIKDETERADRQEERLRDYFQKSINSFSGRKPPSSHDSAGLAAQVEQKRNQLDQKTKALTILEAQLSETQELITMGVCPRCGQHIPGDFAGRTTHLEEEIKILTSEITTLKEEHSQLSILQEEMRSYERDKEQNARMTKDASDLDREITGARKRVHDAQAEADRLRGQLSEARLEGDKLKQVSNRITDAEYRRDESLRKKDDATKRLAYAVKQKESEVKMLQELAHEITKKKKMKTDAQKLSDYQSWLSDFFRPTVEVIEKQTLVQANARFNYHFQRFFLALVDDPDLNVRVKEDFSPVFERQGFEQDFETLSGGERTSVALAFRFALSVIAAEDTSGQGELVILDEPTDGFSKEQIHKMRDLLEELHSKQVLLVSHERELESMSDMVFHIDKVNATSRVTRS